MLSQSAILLGLILGIYLSIIVNCQKLTVDNHFNPPSDIDQCLPCEQVSCKDPPVGCLAGLVVDRCGCCKVCGLIEGHPCRHPELPAQLLPPASVVEYELAGGQCGEHLDCRLTDEGSDSSLRARCVCRTEGTFCASDGLTYTSLCKILESAILTNQKISVTEFGPCKIAPVITNPPADVKSRSGTNVALSCQAHGFPIPTIEWTWTRVDGKTEYLPRDDLRMSATMRGGPEKYHVTGFLMIMDLQKHHEGDYTCIAQNVLGENQAIARVKVFVDNGERSQQREQVESESIKKKATQEEKLENISIET